VKSFHGVDSDSEGEPEVKKVEINGNMKDYTKIKNTYVAEAKKMEEFMKKWRDNHNGELPTEE